MQSQSGDYCSAFQNASCKVQKNDKKKVILSKKRSTEFSWLRERTVISEREFFCRKILPAELSNCILDLLNSEEWDITRWNQIKRHAIAFISEYKIEKGIRYKFTTLYRDFAIRTARAMRHPINMKKTLYSRGKLISFLGVDGSGKTTVAKDIQKWLSWKIDCRYVYLGTGQGKSSILNRLLRYRAQKKLSKGYVKETTEVKSESGDPKKTKGIKKAFRRTILNVVSLSNVQYKFRTIKKIDRLINKGVVVITDRYPQNEYFGINDGPTITNTGNPVLDVINNFLSRQENRIIDKTLQYHPDVIIKLIIPLEVSRSRKQDSPVALIERKIEIIGDIHYNGAAEFCVPSDTTIEETENEVKRIVWENVVAFCDK